MPISQQLIRLARNVGALTADTNAIFEALRAKGVTVPQNATLHDVPELIGELPPMPVPVSTDPTITFRFANANFDPTAEEQVASWNDADCWERVAGSEYNDWKYTAKENSLQYAFQKRLISVDPSYSISILPGATTVIDSANLDKLTSIEDAFDGCDELIWTPDFDVSNITNCNDAFYNCSNVTAYQLYVKLAAVPNIRYNSYTFSYVADANLIPSDWGGTA